MCCIDSACFDSLLIRKDLETVVSFHVTNLKDPDTKLLVDGTISTFVCATLSYQPIKTLGKDISENTYIVARHNLHITFNTTGVN